MPSGASLRAIPDRTPTGDGAAHCCPDATRRPTPNDDPTAAQDVRGLGDDLTRVVSFGVFPMEASLITAIAPIDCEEWEASGLTDREITVTVERLTLEPGACLPEFALAATAPDFSSSKPVS